MAERRLIRSVVRCELCGDVVVVEGRGRSACCECESVYVGNGLTGQAIMGNPDTYTNLSEWEELPEPDPMDPVTGLFSLN